MLARFLGVKDGSTSEAEELPSALWQSLSHGCRTIVIQQCALARTSIREGGEVLAVRHGGAGRAR
jgi:hypothetical protein